MSKSTERTENQADFLHPKEYFDDPNLTHSAEVVRRKLNNKTELSQIDVEKVCQNYFPNQVYNLLAENGKRDEALELSASAVLNNGKVIKEQLLQNDQNAANAGVEQSTEGNSKENTTKDIPKISGGTMSIIIKKINEMLNGKSGDEHQAAAENFSALFEVLNLPTAVDKFDEVMKKLAESPVAVAGIKENLKDTKGATIFEDALERNFNPKQKDAVAQVTKSELNSQKEKDVQKHAQKAGTTR